MRDKKHLSLPTMQNKIYADGNILLYVQPTRFLLINFGPSLVFYPRPIEQYFSLSHDEIGQSPPSFSCYLGGGIPDLGRNFRVEKLLKNVFI